MAGGRATDWLSRAAWFAGLWALAHLLAVALTYQVYPGHLDHNESSLVALTRLMIDGHTVYGGFDSPDRVSHAHGPMTFLWHALPQLLFGGGTGAGRAGATAATLLVPLVMAATALARGTVPALLALSLGSAGILLHLNLSIVVRPDGPITLLVACAVLLAARSGKGLVASLLMGLCMGAVVAFKINAGLYLVPVVLYHVAADPIRRLAVIGAVSAAVAALPFAFDAFPPAEYLSMLAGVAGKENTWRGFTALWWKFALYLTIPPAIWLAGGRAAWAATDRPTKAYLAAYLAAVAVTVWPATKTGAGHYYFLPFMPLLADLSLRGLAAGGATTRQRATLTGLVVLCLAASWQPERRFFKSLDWDEARAVTAEIDAVMAAHPGKTIQMGVGGAKSGNQLSYRLYSYKALLAAAGHPYTLDTGIVMEHTKLGIAMPEATLARFDICHTDLWLIPAGEDPFSLWGYYGQHVYDARFRETFARTHVKVATGTYFDLWQCRGKP